jgi:hypothetical protein
LCPLGTAATNGPIVPAPGDYDDGEIGGIIDRGSRSTRRKPAPLCPPQNPTCCSDAKPDRRGEKLVTNRLSYGTAKVRDTLRLAVYRQSVHLRAKPLETYDQRFFLTEHLQL